MKKRKSLIESSRDDLMNSIMESRLMKIIKTTAFIVGGVYAFGVGCKILNFSMKNFSELKKTLQ